MRIHYLGPPKSFSEQAASEFATRIGPAETHACPNIEAIADEIGRSEPGRALGVLPYYNFLEGLVQESLDLTYEHGLVINAAVRVPIRFALGGTAGASRARTEVLSHPKALAQCSDYLAAHLPEARQTAAASTSEAARLAGETPHALAIATEAALREHGHEIVANDVGNLRYGRANFTDFFIVGRADERQALGLETDRTMLAITPPTDRPGLLADVLSLFAFVRLNIAKIHSRPALEDVDMDIEPQMFYVEIMTEPESEALTRTLEMLSYRFKTVEGFARTATTRIMGGFKILDD